MKKYKNIEKILEILKDYAITKKEGKWNIHNPGDGYNKYTEHSIIISEKIIEKMKKENFIQPLWHNQQNKNGKEQYKITKMGLNKIEKNKHWRAVKVPIFISIVALFISIFSLIFKFK